MALVRTFRVLDPTYPPALRDLRDPPDPVEVEGDLPAEPGIAVVGTREASAGAIAWTRELCAALARAGVPVWSGGAAGIDRAAHEGAMQAGGRTVVVVGTGLGHVFPPDHADLYARAVAGGGALLAVFERRQRAARWTFLRRNGALAAMTRALVVVQAPLASGARSAAAAARRIGRPVFAVPGAPWDPLGAGTLAEIERGASPIATPAALLDRIGAIDPAPRPVRTTSGAASRSAPERTWTEAERAVIAGLPGPDAPPAHADAIGAAAGLDARAVQEALLTLALDDILEEGPAGFFRRSC